MKNTLLIFTRTPLHVGAGASVGAIDQPIIRERHTSFPVIPASSLKGSFADLWNGDLRMDVDTGERTRGVSEAAWLFGSNDPKKASAGALLFGEARLVAFPIRSAKGSFAWITSPLALRRAARDGVIPQTALDTLVEPNDDQAIFDSDNGSKLAIETQVVLEEYTFRKLDWMGLRQLGDHLAALLPEDPVWGEIKDRLVILSDGMLSFFVRAACEVAQHVCISDETGTAEVGKLFNQENVPSETLFYSRIETVKSRSQQGKGEEKNDQEAMAAFQAKLPDDGVMQFGGDASTGLGYCTVQFKA